jgi:hypothetical protein
MTDVNPIVTNDKLISPTAKLLEFLGDADPSLVAEINSLNELVAHQNLLASFIQAAESRNLTAMQEIMKRYRECIDYTTNLLLQIKQLTGLDHKKYSDAEIFVIRSYPYPEYVFDLFKSILKGIQLTENSLVSLKKYESEVVAKFG